MRVTSKAMQINGRPVLARGGAETLNSLIASLAAKGLTITLCIGLAACAEDRNYPSLSKISELGDILTPLGACLSNKRISLADRMRVGFCLCP